MMADVNRASLHGGVLLGGVSIGAFLLTLFVARRFIGRPTRTLLAAARRWRDGDLGTPVPGEDSPFGVWPARRRLQRHGRRAGAP